MQHAQDLIADYTDQKDMMEDVDKMYFMDWDDKPKGREFKFTTSPSARNALLGAIRIMTSTEPKFSVPFDTNRKEAKAISETIEKFCKTVWYHSGRFRGVPLEQAAIESLLRYGMMVLSITSTQDLKEMYDLNGASKAQMNQVNRLVESTPYLFEAWDPKGVYPEWGRFGLSAVYRTVEMTVAQVIDQFGEEPVIKIIGDDPAGLNERVQYADYWDLEKHMAWISSTVTGGETVIAGNPIVDKKHELPCIPIVVQTSEGSYIDAKKEYQAIPFLYGVLKGELWQRQNLELTYLYTNLFQIAANPQYKHISPNKQDDLVVDHSVPGGRVVLGPNEDLVPLEKDVINKDMLHGLTIADQLMEESTIYRQALGGTAGLGANVAFSTVSLLNQVGRMSLISPQKRGAWALGTICELMMELIKDKNELQRAKGREGFIDFDPKQIPDDLIIEAKLEVDLPQDLMSQANIAQLVTQAGLASRRWAREEILGIGQSEEMDKEIWDDQAAMQAYQKILMAMQQMEMQQQQQQAAQQAAAQTPQNQPRQRGPVSPGSAMQAQAGLIPGQRPGTRPAPAQGEGMPMQEGEMPQ